MDLYHRQRSLERVVAKLQESRDVNRDLILRWYESSLAEGLSTARIVKRLQTIMRLSGMLGKSFDEASKDNIVRLAAEINNLPLREWTKQNYKAILKRFYKWLNGGEDYPDKVKFIKLSLKEKDKLLPEELLTPKDVEKLAEACTNPRDKAFILTAYESGCRIGELLSLHIKHVQFDQYGAVLMVKGKTGMRRVRVIASSPALATWLEHHPSRLDPEQPLWIGIGSNQGNKVEYPGIRKMLRNLAERVGIRKRVNPHLFRHSRATYLASKLTEAQMREYFGWTRDSKMASVYVHLSGRDVDNALLKLEGFDVEDEEKDRNDFKLQLCPRCRQRYSPGCQFCPKCGLILDDNAAVKLEAEWREVDSLMNRLMQDQVFKGFLEERLKQLLAST